MGCDCAERANCTKACEAGLRVSRQFLGGPMARGSDATNADAAAGLATLVCSTDARVLWASTEAEAYLRAGVLCLHRPAGMLRLDEPGENAALQAALARVRAGDRSPSELVIEVEGGEDAVWCVVIPLHAPGEGEESAQPTAALLLQRSDAPVGVEPRQLVDRLHLSRAEAEVVAGLMHGDNLPAIAARRGTKVETIRGYLKSARRKLGCHTQSELVTRGWRAIAVIPDLAAPPTGT